jgi:NMD protein affecting ribosome stability and mRNA decay
MMSEWKGRQRDRLIQEHDHNTYKSKRKLPEPTVCPQCGAVFHEGRWTWAPRPEGAHETLCPACERARDRYPAGYVNVGGEFFREHREELLSLVRNIESREKAEHPLKRILGTENRDGAVLITTTDIHLARTIGDALHHAYEGKLDYQYAEESKILHVSWER